MMSASQMNRMADDAAKRAKRNALKPQQYVSQAQGNKIPFLGDYVPKGFKRVEAADPGRWTGAAEGYLEVDSSGFGGENEPALTMKQFEEYAAKHPEYYYGIVEAGQFQVVLATYVPV